MKYKDWEHGSPTECLPHTTHPCGGCGRIGGVRVQGSYLAYHTVKKALHPLLKELGGDELSDLLKEYLVECLVLMANLGLNGKMEEALKCHTAYATSMVKTLYTIDKPSYLAAISSVRLEDFYDE